MEAKLLWWFIYYVWFYISKKLNNIEYIEPDEEKKFRLEFKVLASKKNIDEVKNKLSK